MVNSRWSDIFIHLKNANFNVFPPGLKGGDCTQPYVVVKDAGISEDSMVSSNIALYDIMVYVPKNQYSELEPYIASVKQSMDELFPMIRPTHFQTTSYFDDTVKAWMVSIQYQNYQKKTRR